MSTLVIRPFRSTDGAGISELFRRVYGDHYVSPDVYLPRMICQYNAQQHWRSMVAVLDEHVVGHAALCRGLASPSDAELALMAVDRRCKVPGLPPDWASDYWTAARTLAWPGCRSSKSPAIPSANGWHNSWDSMTPACSPTTCPRRSPTPRPKPLSSAVR